MDTTLQGFAQGSTRFSQEAEGEEELWARACIVVFTGRQDWAMQVSRLKVV